MTKVHQLGPNIATNMITRSNAAASIVTHSFLPNNQPVIAPIAAQLPEMRKRETG